MAYIDDYEDRSPVLVGKSFEKHNTMVKSSAQPKIYSEANMSKDLISLKNPTDLAVFDNAVNAVQVTSESKNDTDLNHFDKNVHSDDQKATIVDSKTISNISHLRAVEAYGTQDVKLSSEHVQGVHSSVHSMPNDIQLALPMDDQEEEIQDQPDEDQVADENMQTNQDQAADDQIDIHHSLPDVPLPAQKITKMKRKTKKRAA